MIRSTLAEHEHMRLLGHYVPELSEQGKQSIRNFATVAFDGCSFLIGGKYTAGFRGVRAIRAIRLAQPNTARAGVSGINVVRPPTNVSVRRVYRGTGGAHKTFRNQRALDDHFSKHGTDIQTALSRRVYSKGDYLRDANFVIRNGTFVSELNGYVRLIGGTGKAKYAFVGLDKATGQITTFHIKRIPELIKNAPSLRLQ